MLNNINSNNFGTLKQFKKMLLKLTIVFRIRMWI